MGGNNPTQEFTQMACHKYGWSARFAKESVEDGRDDKTLWVAHVIVGLHDERRFVSDDHESPDDTPVGTKKGIASASRAALEGLAQELAVRGSMPRMELTQVFPLYPPAAAGQNQRHHQKPRFFIKGSSQRNWDEFIWKKQPQPKIVGVDCEGNQSYPPVLVQVATDDCVILEITSMNGNQLSHNMQRLLADNSIRKVFCDNFSHHDKKSLGLLHAHNDNTNNNKDYSTGPIVDLEVLASHPLGPVKVPRGLSRIITLVMPELGVVVGKPPNKTGKRMKDVGRFTMIEQGKAPPITSLRDLSHKEKFYAAMDAWATLQAYKRLVGSEE
ncbi:expressed unknown protein [Seminavis robusta]|uniref:3'-5' exonuclease domain-containing protein n=1 Tax=Seminavis robusta TaxID=568900 RepID=A0A9N8E9E1_9STRA|nr:expressed unknown protein [Seminavis robusta]|eukprot:Sro692_g188150.1 n/a (328) ;mRNA; r:42443-43426